MKNILNPNFDNVAIGFSVICAVHCLFLPVIILLFPAISASIFGSEDFHSLLLYFIIPSSVIALTLGCNKHGKFYVYFYGIIGITILLAASFFGHDYLGETGEIILTLVGTTIISFGHFKNQKLCDECCN